MSYEIINDMHSSDIKEYVVLPYWSEDNTISYEKYSNQNETICSIHNLIHVEEQDFFGYKGIPGCGVPVIERHYKFEFLGNWFPKLLEREGNYIKRDKLFILPTIEITIFSIDAWSSFTAEQRKDIKLWNKPKVIVKLRGDYDYCDVDKSGFGHMTKRNLDVEFPLEQIDSVEAAITAVIFLDSFDSDEFQPEYLLRFINSILRLQNDTKPKEDLIMASDRLIRIYKDYPFISLSYKNNVQKHIMTTVHWLNNRIKLLERQHKELGYID